MWESQEPSPHRTARPGGQLNLNSPLSSALVESSTSSMLRWPHEKKGLAEDPPVGGQSRAGESTELNPLPPRPVGAGTDTPTPDVCL